MAEADLEADSLQHSGQGREHAIDAMLARAGVPLHGYGHCTLDNFMGSADPKALHAVRQWVGSARRGEGTGLYLWSTPDEEGDIRTGNGKTHLAVGALRDLVEDEPERQFYIKFVNVADWYFRIQDTINTGGSSYNLVEELKTPEVLVMDDLGVENATAWALRSLYLVLEYRQGMSTLFTSNHDLEGWEARADGESRALARRVADRIAGVCGRGGAVAMSGPSRRGER